jgi:hypothetical protein
MDEDTYVEMMARLSGGEVPNLVFDTLVTRFRDDLEALGLLVDKETPPVISDRVSRILTVIYAFMDASGLSFGDTFLIRGNIEFTIGIWGEKEEAQSSNYRKLCNTVDAIEQHALDGNLDQSIIYFCTDNSTVENALYHGRSKESRLLHELVVRLKVLEAHYGFQLLVIHVAGKRMQAQGTDGVSWGQLMEGVMNGESMMSFVPLHETALERSPLLKDWLKTYVSSNLEFLSADDWFERGHNHFGKGKIHLFNTLTQHNTSTMAEKREKGESGEKPSTSSNDTGRIPQGNGRRAFKKPIVRQPKFEGNCEELKGHVFDCSNSRHADIFSKTTKALAGHVGKTYRYGSNVRLAIQNLSPTILEVPKDLPDSATKAELRIWEKKIDQFVKRDLYFEENMQTLYSLVWGQCSDIMQARLEALDDYDAMSEKSDSLALLKAIRAQAYNIQSQKNKANAIHCNTTPNDAYSCCVKTGTRRAQCTLTAFKTV